MNREFLPIAILALMFAIAFYVDPLVKTNEEDKVFAQWLAGTGSGMISKVAGVYLIPIISAIAYLGLLLIPKIAVYKENIEDFAEQFWGFKVIFVFAMGVIYVATLLPNLGFASGFDPMIIIVSAVSILFFYIGYMLNFTKRNYFIGVRTPWTLADEKVWEKTNKVAGKLFWVCGALSLFSLATPPYARIWVLIIPVLLVTIGVSLYSLWEYKKLKKMHAKGKGAGRKRRK